MLLLHSLVCRAYLWITLALIEFSDYFDFGFAGLTVSLTRTSLAVSKPVINVSQEIVFSSGVNVTVRCIGDRPVTWNSVPSTKVGNRRTKETYGQKYGRTEEGYKDGRMGGDPGVERGKTPPLRVGGHTIQSHPPPPTF